MKGIEIGDDERRRGCDDERSDHCPAMKGIEISASRCARHTASAEATTAPQ